MLSHWLGKALGRVAWHEHLSGPEVQWLETAGQLCSRESVPVREDLSREPPWLQLLVHYYSRSIWWRHIMVVLRRLRLWADSPYQIQAHLISTCTFLSCAQRRCAESLDRRGLSIHLPWQEIVTAAPKWMEGLCQVNLSWFTACTTSILKDTLSSINGLMFLGSDFWWARLQRKVIKVRKGPWTPYLWFWGPPKYSMVQSSMKEGTCWQLNIHYLNQCLALSKYSVRCLLN